MAELADAPDLGSGVQYVGVQVPLPAPKKDSLWAVFFYPIRRIGMKSRVSGYVIAAGVCYHSSSVSFGLITYIFLRKWLHADFVGFHARLCLDLYGCKAVADCPLFSQSEGLVCNLA